MKLDSYNGNHCIIRLEKDSFSRSHVNDLKNQVIELVTKDIKSLFIDFTNVENIDQIGFGVLLTIQQMAVRYQFDIKLFGLNQNIKYIIEKAFNNAIFDVFEAPSAQFEETSLRDALIA